jgi:hypothetical protein
MRVIVDRLDAADRGQERGISALRVRGRSNGHEKRQRAEEWVRSHFLTIQRGREIGEQRSSRSAQSPQCGHGHC